MKSFSTEIHFPIFSLSIMQLLHKFYHSANVSFEIQNEKNFLFSPLFPATILLNSISTQVLYFKTLTRSSRFFFCVKTIVNNSKSLHIQNAIFTFSDMVKTNTIFTMLKQSTKFKKRQKLKYHTSIYKIRHLSYKGK